MKRAWLLVLPWAVALSTSPHNCEVIPGGRLSDYEVRCSTEPYYELTYKGRTVAGEFQGTKDGRLRDYADKMNAAIEVQEEKPAKLSGLPI